MSLPAADDLFRPTSSEAPSAAPSISAAPAPAEQAGEPEEPEAAGSGSRRPSGRVRHDEKMTVYITSDELLDIEHARLMMRRTQGLAVDRGRLVREAVALALADFEENGADSAIVRRLTDS